MDVYPELEFPTYGLNPMIDYNNQALEQIRSIYAKCNAIRNNVPVKYKGKARSSNQRLTLLKRYQPWLLL